MRKRLWMCLSKNDNIMFLRGLLLTKLWHEQKRYTTLMHKQYFWPQPWWSSTMDVGCVVEVVRIWKTLIHKRLPNIYINERIYCRVFQITNALITNRLWSTAHLRFKVEPQPPAHSHPNKTWYIICATRHITSKYRWRITSSIDLHSW